MNDDVIIADYIDSGLVKLPDEKHTIHRWTIHSGAAVRRGETVALAVLNTTRGSSNGALTYSTTSAAAATMDAAQPAASKGHRRPMKRSRPVPGAAPGATFLASDPRLRTTEAPAAVSIETVPILATTDGILRIIEEATRNASLVVGRIEPCTHPTVLGKLCAVCGQTVTNDARTVSAPPNDTLVKENGSNENHNSESSTMTRMTVSGGLTVSISHEESIRMAQEDAQRMLKLGKLSLVLDLDHTLVHATNDIRAAEHLDQEDVRSILLPMTEEAVGGPPFAMHDNNSQQSKPLMQHFIKFRPHLKAFFERLQSHYEFGVYTAGTRNYAEQVCLVIARFLVGAKYDDIHLLDLRHRIFSMEHDLHLRQGQDEMDDDAKHDLVSIDGEIQPTQEDNVIDDGREAPKSKKRKVTFGEPAAELKSDHATEDRLAELRAEITEAERMETLAQEMRQKIFGSRVVSRTDVGDLGRDVKCLKRIFPCGGAMAVVVDDREDVWARAQGVIFADRPGEPPDNLLLVRPYHWDTFDGFADVNNAAGVDLSNFGDKQARHRSELDLQLLWTCNALVRLHEEYYNRVEAHQEATVPQILAEMRQRVLSQAHIVLSGLVPLLHQQRIDSDKQPRPAVVRYVESLGATHQTILDTSTTHVIASKDGTDKIISARRLPGCFVVKPSWLMECVWSLTRRNEQAHLLGPPPTDRHVELQNQEIKGHRTEAYTGASSSSSSDEEDDDLAAELAKEMSEK
ncbi:hypothetical protein MPSEU_000271700 [Mayamaea pseudoterrestris]|nr:hypothetical protein MPSEU_000271700 [Mayamaea pseudoterrestris]